MAPVLADRAPEGEELRTMPPDLVDRLRDAGLFHLAIPTALGGQPVDPATIIQVIEELSRADGSAGWTTFIGNSSCFVAWLEPDVARDVLARPANPIMASAFAPTGQAVPDGEGWFRVGGRWAFTSGAPHADWFVNGVMVMDGAGPRILDGRPDWRFAWVPASDVEVVDTWRAAGLRGTGSHHTQVQDVRVRAEFLPAPLFEPACADDTLFRMPFFSLLMVAMAGFPLGVATRALDEFVTLAQSKSRRSDATPLLEDEAVQVEVGRLDGALAAARAFVFDAAGELWDSLRAGELLTVGQRARMSSAVHQAFRSGLSVVDTTFRLAGGSALYDASPLQRCLRDLHAGAQHIAVGLGQERSVGRVRLGVETQTLFL